jgi:hypothetical protein
MMFDSNAICVRMVHRFRGPPCGMRLSDFRRRGALNFLRRRGIPRDALKGVPCRDYADIDIGRGRPSGRPIKTWALKPRAR